MSPITEIQKDLLKLVTLIEQGSIHAPDFHVNMLQKQSYKILKKYRIKIKYYPPFKKHL